MDSAALHRFIVMAEAGSLSKAATRLGITQPALSRTLQALESHYGAELLRRGAAGVALTSFGQAVLVRAKLIQAELRHLDSEINALRNLATGQVHVGIPSGIGFTSEVLPAATLALLTQGSRLEITYTIGTREDLLASLRRGDLDFIISDVSAEGDVRDLVQQPMFSDHTGVFVRAAHPLALARKVATGALCAYPWAVLSDSGSLESTLLRSLADAGARFASSRLRSNSALFVRSIVARSDAIGLMSLDAARPDIDRGLLVELHPQARDLQPVPVRALGLIHRREAVLSTAAQALIAQISAACARRPAHGSRARVSGSRVPTTVSPAGPRIR